MARREALGLPCAPITERVDLLDDPHLLGSSGLVPVTLPDGRVLPLDGERLPLRHDLPAAGQHNGEIRAELGWTPDASAA